MKKDLYCTMEEKTIARLVAEMKKRELTALAFRMGMPPPPRGREALQEWRKQLADNLPHMDANIRMCLGMRGINSILALLDEAEDGLSVPVKAVRGTVAEYDLRLLECLALAWHDRREWHAAPETAAILAVTDEEEAALLEAGDDLEDAMSGYLMFYGMLRVEEIQRMLLGREDKDAAEMMLTVWSRRRGLDSVMMAGGEIWVVSEMAEDPERLYLQIRRPDRLLIPYAKVTERQAREALKNGVTGDLTLTRKLIALGRRAGKRRDDVLDVIAQAEHAFRMDERHGAVEILCADYLGGKHEALAQLLASQYVRTIPSWHVKGHTMNDAAGEEKPARAQWGGLCPCGSGRSYGACCGRAQ